MTIKLFTYSDGENTYLCDRVFNDVAEANSKTGKSCSMIELADVLETAETISALESRIHELENPPKVI